MAKILLIGGSKDGQIVEREFKQDGALPLFNDGMVHRIDSQSHLPVNVQEMTYDVYHMDTVVVDGVRYAYATAKSIQGHVVIELVKASSVPPFE